VNAWIALALILSTVSLWALAILAGRAERKIDRAIGEIIRMRIEIERASGGGSGPVERQESETLADLLAPPPEEPRRRAKPIELSDEHEWRLSVEGKVPEDR